MDAKYMPEQGKTRGGGGEFPKMKEPECQSSNCWSGCYHQIAPGKTLYTIYPTGDGPSSAKHHSFRDQRSPSVSSASPGQNTYMSLDDYYKLHGQTC